MKFSEDPIKTLLPGIKAVVRVYTDSQKPSFDLICMRNEVESLCESKKVTYYEEKNLDMSPKEIEV